MKCSWWDCEREDEPLPSERLTDHLGGGPYHPECYIDALPPYPGPEVDPELLKAHKMVAAKK